MDSGAEVSGGFVVMGCDGAELLEFCEEVLDQVSCFIEVADDTSWRFSGLLWAG
jgi:hypothetical protein